MIRNITWILLTLAILSGCKSSITDRLISKINRDCGSRTEPMCTIVLKDATGFKWDKLYLFGAWTISDSIKNKIRVNYDGEDVQDDYRRLLFTYNDKVVYEEDFKSFDYGNSTIGISVDIDSLLQAKVPYFTPSNAIFTVDKGKIEGSCDKCFEYSLTPQKK
ncbi:hypothetical protein [Mucilaginibacter kameinonensis]|uniref:hypothetical protein n=1 Tax=Mucilaginibacter kameinonensis TaxID=452286 RepID=UPI0013CEB043|nr:hypothetical protein [Mucilaginibacter kameinonensis]